MPRKPLRILVIDADRTGASIIEDGMGEAGSAEVIVVADACGLVKWVPEIDPDIVVMNLASPDRHTLESMFQVSRAIKRPVAIFVDRTDQQSIDAAIDAGVSAYVVDGLEKKRVRTVIDTAISRYRYFENLQRELTVARDELASRKTIERAKGILMRSRRLNEDEAYGLLRQTAMNQSRRIAEVADSLVAAADLLGGGD